MAVCSPIGGMISDRLVKRYGARAGRVGVAMLALVLTAVFLTVGSHDSLVPSAHCARVRLDDFVPDCRRIFGAERFGLAGGRSGVQFWRFIGKRFA